MGLGFRADPITYEDRQKNMSSLTMWEVLDLAQMEVSTSDKYSRIFRTYAKAFKGARQIRPSNGLLELLGLKNLEEDEDLANQKKMNLARFMMHWL